MLAGALYLLLNGVQSLMERYNATEGPAPLSPLLIMLVVVYAVLIAIPFMPGIELGIALLVMQGAAIAPFVYLATVVALMTAYLLGRIVPLERLARLFASLGLRRASGLVDAIRAENPQDRLDGLRQRLPNWLARLTIDYRYVLIGLLLNVPGTFTIGGGGGILLIAGLSRLFRSWAILLTLLIATLPVPLAVWFFGTQILP